MTNTATENTDDVTQEADEVTVLFDADAYQAARRAKRGPAKPTIRSGGKVYELIPEPTLEILELVDVSPTRALRQMVVGDSNGFDPSGWTIEDVRELLRKVYGIRPTT